MTVLEVVALLTLIFTVIFETIQACYLVFNDKKESNRLVSKQAVTSF